jgi:hypothetical protein
MPLRSITSSNRADAQPGFLLPCSYQAILLTLTPINSAKINPSGARSGLV